MGENSNLIIGRTDLFKLVPVAVDANGHLQIDVNAGANLIGSVGIEGYFNGAWAKSPIPFGVSGLYRAQNSNTNLTAGTNYLNIAALTANRVYVITNLTFWYIGTVLNLILNPYILNGTYYFLSEQRNVITSYVYSLTGIWLVATSADTIGIRVLNATAGDDLYIQATGFYYETNL